MTLSNVLLAICLLTAINLKLIKTFNSTKCHRLCICLNSTTIDCSNKNLTSVPNDLPIDTKVLLLNNNHIEKFPPLAFSRLSNLTKVDLSGNKFNCGCGLTWTKYANFSIQVVAACHRPAWVEGRSFADLTMEDMCRTCKMNSSTLGKISLQPKKDGYKESDIVQLTCPSGYLIRGPASLMCLANGTWNSTALPHCQEIPSTTPAVGKITSQDTVQVPATTVSQQNSTTVEISTPATGQATVTRRGSAQTTTAEPLTTTVEPHTTTVEPHTTTVEPKTSKSSTTDTAETKTTTEDSASLPTLAPVPTDVKNDTGRFNLTRLVEVSDSKELSAESLWNLIVSLESQVYGRNSSDTMAIKNVLLVSSNVLKEDNNKAWSKVNKNVPGGERLLNVVNEAIKHHAIEMLKSTKIRSQHIFFNNSNIVAEIQVVIADDVADKEIQFPYSKSPEDDYVQISGSSLKKAGKEKVAVIGMKSLQLGKLLPQRSMIDGFDSFNTGSGLLSASVLSLQEKFSSSVRITFKNKIYLGDDEELAKCTFWKYDNQGKNAYNKTSCSTKSGWSDKGCQVLSRNRTTTVCHCDHTTDFAVLTQNIVVIPEPTILMYIAGLGLLIGATIACVRDIFVWRQTRHERLSVLVNECVAMILTAVVFLLGLFLDYHQIMCMIFSALLQWFVLAVFCWILTEFLQLYLCTHYGWNRSSSRTKYFVILGWVVPLVVVGITLAITRQNDYGSEQWCWYSNSPTVLLTYVCPIVLSILLSILFILKIGCFKNDATDESEKKDISVIVVLSGFLIPLVLCAFTTAALSARQPEEKVFQYLFVVFGLLLAVYIVVYHCWMDREIMKLSVRKNVERPRPKRDYYSTKETVMYSEDTSEGKSFSLIFPSRKSPKKKPKPKKDERKPAKRSDSSSPFDYNSTVPLYPSVNDSSLKSFKSQVSTHQHTFDTPPNTLSAITISRPNSTCIELTSLSDLDRRPDGAEQTDAGERGEFYGSRHSNPFDKERQRTSGCSTDCTNATTFGKEKVVQKPSDAPSNDGENKNRISGASSAGLSRTSRSSVSGTSLTAAAEENIDDDTFETQPFIRADSDLGPEIRSDPPVKIPKRRKRGSSRRRLDDEYHDDDKHEPKIKTRQSSSSLPSTESSVKLKQYTSF